MSAPRNAVIFDAMETLGTEIAATRTDRFVAFRPSGSARRELARVEGIERAGVFALDPAIPVDRLRERIAALELQPMIDPELVGGAEPGVADPFDRYLMRSNLQPENVVFVSHDAKSRSHALRSGAAACPHVRLLGSVLAGRRLNLVRLSGALHEQQVAAIDATRSVPVLWTIEQEHVVYALTDDQSVAGFGGSAAFAVEVLGAPDMILETTLIMLQVTDAQAVGFPDVQAFLAGLADSGLPLFRATPKGFLVALPADRSPKILHPPPPASAHGHARVLRPSMTRAARDPLQREFPRRNLTPREKGVFADMSFGSLDDTAQKWGMGASDGNVDDSGAVS